AGRRRSGAPRRPARVIALPMERARPSSARETGRRYTSPRRDAAFRPSPPATKDSSARPARNVCPSPVTQISDEPPRLSGTGRDRLSHVRATRALPLDRGLHVPVLRVPEPVARRNDRHDADALHLLALRVQV